MKTLYVSENNHVSELPPLTDDTGYPHNGRADKDSYPHDRHNQCIMLSL